MNRTRTLLGLALLCAAGTAYADIAIKGPEKVSTGELVVLTVDTDATPKQVVWKVETRDRKKVKYVRVQDQKAIAFTGVAGDYYITATRYLLDKESGAITPEEAEYTVTIGAPAPPNPNPGPNPGPTPNPTPDQALTKTLSDALAKDTDTDKAEIVKKLASIYRAASTGTAKDTSLKTAGDIDAVIRKTAQQMLGNVAAPNLRDKIGEYLYMKLPDPKAALDDALRNRYADTFATLATALEGVR